MKKTLGVIAFLGYFGICVLLVAGLGYLWYSTGPAPVQPIAFPHTVHAGGLQMPCVYCHTFVAAPFSAAAFSIVVFCASAAAHAAASIAPVITLNISAPS